jgi:hypothetical protein
MDDKNLARTIRLFLRDLFGSRLSSHLETEIFQLRGDFEARLEDRERVIADLKERIAELKAKATQYEIALEKTSSLSSLFAPAKPKQYFQGNTEPVPMTWAEVQADHARKQEEEKLNGVSNEGR